MNTATPIALLLSVGTGLIGDLTGQNDLIMRSVRPDPVQAQSGARVEVEYVVRNNSPIEVDDVVVGFYYSTDATLDPSDQLLETEDIDIDEFSSEGDSEQFRLPSSLPDGLYYLIVAVDIFDQVVETNEQNNSRSVRLQIGSGGIRASSTTRLPCSTTTIPDSLETNLARIRNVAIGFIGDPHGTANLSINTNTVWLVAAAPSSSSPCGTVLPTFGIGSAPGELFLSTSTPPISIPEVTSYGGPGQPARHQFLVPDDPSLAGIVLYTQGVFVTPAQDLILTNGVELTVGF